jgi:RNA polymerase sigma-70 factor (ECF subfamily)
VTAARVDDLVSAIRQGDVQALNVFLARHRESLADWVRFRLGVPPGRAVDESDVIQEVSVKVWQTIRTFDGATETQLLNWVRTYLRWWVIDLSRKRVLETVGRRMSGESASGLLDRLADEGHSPSQMAAQSEQESALRAASSALSNEQITVLTLRDIDGIRLKDIAREFDASPVDVAREYVAARSALREAGVRIHEIHSPTASGDCAPCLSGALARLPPAERDAILLKHLESYTLEEAAAALNTTPAAIGAAVYRGLKTLKAALGPESKP